MGIPAGDGGDAVQIWSLQPELGATATRFVHAAYNKSILPMRVRCLSAFLGLGRTLRALGITETSLTDV